MTQWRGIKLVMRILFVNPYYKPYLGGIERIIERLSIELRQQAKVEAVGVLTTRVYHPERRLIPDLKAHEVLDGIDIFRCTFRPQKLPHIFHADRIFHVDMAGYVSVDLPRILRQFKPDIVHFTNVYWWAGNLETFLCSRRAVHVVSTFFHPVPKIKRTMPHYAVNRWITKRTEAIHVLSALERDQVGEAYGAVPRRTFIIPPGMNVLTSAPNRIATGPINILAVGRLQPQKGQMQLLEMLVELRREADVRLWLAGADAGMGEAILQYIAQHDLTDSVSLFGHCSDEELVTLYREADIFALPTEYESFGLVFIEALAQALPVVTYGVGPIESILTKGAIVVPRNDRQGFLAALRRLVHEQGYRRTLGAEGRELVRAKYSWANMAEQFVQLYSELRANKVAQLSTGRWTGL